MKSRSCSSSQAARRWHLNSNPKEEISEELAIIAAQLLKCVYLGGRINQRVGRTVEPIVLEIGNCLRLGVVRGFSSVKFHHAERGSMQVIGGEIRGLVRPAAHRHPQ
jgi:hypothetical protein